MWSAFRVRCRSEIRLKWCRRQPPPEKMCAVLGLKFPGLCTAGLHMHAYVSVEKYESLVK
jgi:hypothetical protein